MQDRGRGRGRGTGKGKSRECMRGCVIDYVACSYVARVNDEKEVMNMNMNMMILRCQGRSRKSKRGWLIDYTLCK